MEFVVLLGLIMAQGMLVFARSALGSSLKSRLSERSSQGDRGARGALRLLDQPAKLEGVSQGLIGLLALTAGAIAVLGVAPRVRVVLDRLGLDQVVGGWLPFALTLVVVAVIAALLGEAIPRRAALQHPERNAALVARPVEILMALFAPASALVNAPARFLARFLGLREPGETPVSQEEIEVLVHEGTKAGVFEDEEHELIKRVFRFSDRRARSLMTPRNEIVWIDVGDSPEEIRRKVTSSTHAQFPVCDGSLDNLLGIIRAKDFLSEAIELERYRVQGRLAMPLFIFEGTRGLKLLELFKKSQVRIAVVLDEYGAVRGLLTLTDLLEALVGDMSVSAETEEPRAVERGDGTWLFDGLTPLEEFQERLKIAPLPSGDYDTLAGLVVTRLGRIPHIADRVEVAGLRIEVVDMDGNRVDRLLVEPVPETGAPA